MSWCLTCGIRYRSLPLQALFRCLLYDYAYVIGIDICLLQMGPTPASYPMGNIGSFSRGKVAGA
jgi:hypothetical protein